MSNLNKELTYNPGRFNRELGNLLLKEELFSLFSLGCITIFIIFLLSQVAIDVLIMIFFINDEATLKKFVPWIVGGVAIFSLLCTTFFHYYTYHYRYWYENGFVEIKWRKRVIMYDQTTCTWSEESEDRTSQIHDRNIIIKRHFKFKKCTFSIFPNEEVGGGKFVFTFNNQQIEKPNYEFYNSIRNKIEANTANSEKN